MTTDVRIDRSRATDYETIFILRADIDSDASEKAISRVTTAIEASGGKLLKLESWGKRRLAFPIGKQRKGFYIYTRYLGYRGLVTEIERNLRLLDTVLRHMTVALRKDVDPGEINVDPEEVKTRRIEITEEPGDEREESIETSLGLSDEQRIASEQRRDRRNEAAAQADAERSNESGADRAAAAEKAAAASAEKAAAAATAAEGEKPAADKPVESA